MQDVQQRHHVTLILDHKVYGRTVFSHQTDALPWVVIRYVGDPFLDGRLSRFLLFVVQAFDSE